MPTNASVSGCNEQGLDTFSLRVVRTEEPYIEAIKMYTHALCIQWTIEGSVWILSTSLWVPLCPAADPGTKLFADKPCDSTTRTAEQQRWDKDCQSHQEHGGNQYRSREALQYSNALKLLEHGTENLQGIFNHTIFLGHLLIDLEPRHSIRTIALDPVSKLAELLVV
jgi:hypothetical protein